LKGENKNITDRLVESDRTNKEKLTKIENLRTIIDINQIKRENAINQYNRLIDILKQKIEKYEAFFIDDKQREEWNNYKSIQCDSIDSCHILLNNLVALILSLTDEIEKERKNVTQKFNKLKVENENITGGVVKLYHANIEKFNTYVKTHRYLFTVPSKQETTEQSVDSSKEDDNNDIDSLNQKLQKVFNQFYYLLNKFEEHFPLNFEDDLKYIFALCEDKKEKVNYKDKSGNEGLIDRKTAIEKECKNFFAKNSICFDKLKAENWKPEWKVIACIYLSQFMFKEKVKVRNIQDCFPPSIPKHKREKSEIQDKEHYGNRQISEIRGYIHAEIKCLGEDAIKNEHILIQKLYEYTSSQKDPTKNSTKSPTKSPQKSSKILKNPQKSSKNP
jgi:hypothetical protein